MKSRRRAGLNQLGPPPRAACHQKPGYLTRKKKPLSDAAEARLKVHQERHGIMTLEDRRGGEHQNLMTIRRLQGLDRGQKSRTSRRKAQRTKREIEEQDLWSQQLTKPVEDVLLDLKKMRIGVDQARRNLGVTRSELALLMFARGYWEKLTYGGEEGKLWREELLRMSPEQLAKCKSAEIQWAERRRRHVGSASPQPSLS